MKDDYIKTLIWYFSSSQNNRLIVEYDKKINDLTRSITVIKKETNEKLNSVNILNDAELERFFAERYRQYKDSIN